MVVAAAAAATVLVDGSHAGQATEAEVVVEDEVVAGSHSPQLEALVVVVVVAGSHSPQLEVVVLCDIVSFYILEPKCLIASRYFAILVQLHRMLIVLHTGTQAKYTEAGISCVARKLT